METQTLVIEVPLFVKKYCEQRYSEVIEYLTVIQHSRYLRMPNVRVIVLETQGELSRCLIRRQVLPLTVMKKPILLRSAELEYKTYGIEYPISLEEAKWQLIDEFPETNCVAQPYSCHTLIRKRKGCYHLSLSDVVIKAEQRRLKICTA